MNIPEEQATEVYKLIEKEEYNKVVPLFERYDINGLYFEEYGTFLNLAVSKTNKKAVEFLLEHGADVNKMFDGNNVLIFTKPVSMKDVEIFQILLEKGAWILPFYPSNRTVIQNLEDLQYNTENVLSNLERNLEFYDEYNYRQSRGNNNSLEYINVATETQKTQSEIVYNQEVLETVQKEIEIVRPIFEQNVRKLKIKFSGSEREEEMLFDIRAPVAFLVNHIFNFFMGGVGDMDLVVPSFHLKNKRVMNKSRAVGDYGLRDGSVVVVVPKIASARHWEGGRTRKRKGHGKRTRHTRWSR